MLMRIISKKILNIFSEKHINAKEYLDAWHNDVKHADWEDWTVLKKHYPTASSLGNERYVFNIKGNKYRLIVIIKFIKKLVFIRFIGTHKEYDKINAKEV